MAGPNQPPSNAALAMQLSPQLLIIRLVGKPLVAVCKGLGILMHKEGVLGQLRTHTGRISNCWILTNYT